jgi:hypothetical protein
VGTSDILPVKHSAHEGPEIAFPDRDFGVFTHLITCIAAAAELWFEKLEFRRVLTVWPMAKSPNAMEKAVVTGRSAARQNFTV